MQAALFRVILLRISRQNKQALWISQSLRQSKQGNPPANLYQRSVIVLILPDLNQSKSKRCPIPQRGAVKSLYGNEQRISLRGWQKGSVNWIGLSLSLHRSHTAAEFFARLLIRLTVVLHPSQTVSRPGFWSGAVRTMCGKDRRKPPRSTGEIIMGRSVLYLSGSGIQATPNPKASPHCPLKMGNSQRKTLRGKLFPTASDESKRTTREQKSWGTPPVRQ